MRWPATMALASYLGARILGGTSHLYHLRSTSETGPLADGDYAGRCRGHIRGSASLASISSALS